MNSIDELFKEKAILVAQKYGITDATQWDDLPETFRGTIIHVEYKSLIVPLVLEDRGRKMTWQQLSIKYRISVQTVRTILSKANKHALKSNATTNTIDPLK